MKLYLIEQYKFNGYDTFDSAVVAAKNADIAATMHPEPSVPPEEVVVTLIGNAIKGTLQGVILASFKAG